MRIFYIQEGDNGAVYHFYDKDGNELEHTIGALKSMVRYEVEGTPEWDKFYAIATDANNHALVHSGIKWGLEGIKTHTKKDEIGTGKSNTKKLIAASHMLSEGNIYDNKGNIFLLIEDMNACKYEGYSDWFIPSVAELNKLYDSGIEKSYIGDTIKGTKNHAYVWSSVEDASYDAYRVYWSAGDSNYDGKDTVSNSDNVWGCVAARAF